MFLTGTRVGPVARVVNDPVARVLIQTIWGAPALAALFMAAPLMFKPRGAPPPLAAHADEPRFPTRLLTGLARKGDPALEPRKIVAMSPTRRAEIALAFAPPQRARPRTFETGWTAASTKPEDGVSSAGASIDTGPGDGLRLNANGTIYQLADIEPMPDGARCKRLDGVSEPCALRAAARLEVVMRGRAVICDPQDTTGGGPVRAICYAGKINLADDLVRSGLARRSDRVAAL